jgi:hypothetical protein
MSVENREGFDASDLNGRCPKCDTRSLIILSKEYTKNEEPKLIYTVCRCSLCGKEINIFND